MASSASSGARTSEGQGPVQQPSRHAQYGEHWGEGAARCFSIESDILDEDHAVRLMPVPDSFVCPISAAIMVDPVATVDGCVYERAYIERWFRERRQQGNRITSPITGLELPSATLMPLVALQKAIETYLAHRPEIRMDHMTGRCFEEAAQILQADLFEKQATHATTQDKLKRLKQANKELIRALQEAQARMMELQKRAEGPAHADAQESGSSTPSGTGATPSSPAAGLEEAGAAGSPAGDRASAEGPLVRKDIDDEEKRKRSEKCLNTIMARRSAWATPLLALPLALAAAALLTSLGPLTWDAAPSPRSGAPAPLPGGLAQAAGGAATTWAATEVNGHESVAVAGKGRIEGNPAFASHLEQLRSGNEEEKQRAAFMLRIFAAEHAENQEAITQAGAVAPLIALLTDRTAALREEAARALWNLARNSKAINLRNQRAIGRAGAIAPLVRLLDDEVPRVRVVAAAVLNDLATENADNQVEVAKAGAIAPLVRLLEQDEAPALLMAAGLLKSLALGNSDPRVGFALAHAVQPLVSLLQSASYLAQEQAASALGSLAAHNADLQVAIARAGAIVPLVERLEGDVMQGTAALALKNLAADSAENQALIVQAGGIGPLVKLLEDGMPGVREEAARALWNLAVGNLDTQVTIVRANAAIPLVALLKGDAQEQATITLLRLSAKA